MSEVSKETTGIDTSSTAVQTLYTVPTSKVFWPEKILIRDASADITLATMTFGCEDHTGGAAVNFNAGTITLALTSGTEQLWVYSVAGGSECPAASTFAVDTVAQEGAADTVTIEVFGVVR